MLRTQSPVWTANGWARGLSVPTGPLANHPLPKTARLSAIMVGSSFSYICIKSKLIVDFSLKPLRSQCRTRKCSVSHHRPTAPSTAATWHKARLKRPCKRSLALTARFRRFASSKTRATLSSGGGRNSLDHMTLCLYFIFFHPPFPLSLHLYIYYEPCLYLYIDPSDLRWRCRHLCPTF